MTAFKQLGVVGVIGDAPARDIDEMRPLKVQCMFPGTVAGHGSLAVQAVNVPVTVSGMDISPMEVIHMDESGAVKISAKVFKRSIRKSKKDESSGRRKTGKKMRTMTDPEELAAAMG